MSTTIFHYDQSDQGSVDSDYTSYVSSRLNPSSTAGSNSSLNRPTRSISIESTGHPRIPTRHINRSQSTRDPLQFVKIQSTQDQCQPIERRKPLERRQSANNDDEQNDWSKAVDDWRQKRMKKVQSVIQPDPSPISLPIPQSKNEETPKTCPVYETVNKVPSPPSSPPPTNVTRPKSPSPIRRKGPSKIREISIEKSVEIRGFGFKLDGGRTTNRPIFVSTIEEGSPADRSGLNVDDEILAINDQSIENLSFDQVRKILKERNLRGTIKLIIRTYEDTNEDSSHSAVHSKSNLPQSSPVYTFLPYTPSKPARSTDLDHPNPKSSPSEMKFSRKELLTLMNPSSPIEAFRQLLEPGRCTGSIYDKELQDLEAEFEKQLKGIDQKNDVDRPLSTQVIINLPSTTKTTKSNFLDASHEESPISQVRSYVEKQMDQLKQDLEFGFSRGTTKSDVSVVAPLKKSISTQNALDRVPSSRGYGLVVNPNEKVLHYLEPYTPQRPLSQYLQRSIPNLPSMSINSQQQKKVTIRLDDEQMSRKNEKFRRTKRSHFDENLWIEEEDRHRSKSTVPTVSGKLRCSRCQKTLGQGSAMVIESLGLYYHMECFRCFVCNVRLSTSVEGIDVRIRNHRLHCHNCFSDDRGVKLSAV